MAILSELDRRLSAYIVSRKVNRTFGVVKGTVATERWGEVQVTVDYASSLIPSQSQGRPRIRSMDYQIGHAWYKPSELFAVRVQTPRDGTRVAEDTIIYLMAERGDVYLYEETLHDDNVVHYPLPKNNIFNPSTQYRISPVSGDEADAVSQLARRVATMPRSR